MEGGQPADLRANRMTDNDIWVDARWRQLGGPEPEHEYRFAPPRRWRFDRAWPGVRVALEIEGRGHSQWNRYHADIEKYNTAAVLGWTVLRISFLHVQDDDVTWLAALVGVLEQRRGASR